MTQSLFLPQPLLLAAIPAWADETRAPKLGPDAIPITQRIDYLRSAPAPTTGPSRPS